MRSDIFLFPLPSDVKHALLSMKIGSGYADTPSVFRAGQVEKGQEHTCWDRTGGGFALQRL